jgi:hypothetical protein
MYIYVYMRLQQGPAHDDEVGHHEEAVARQWHAGLVRGGEIVAPRLACRATPNNYHIYNTYCIYICILERESVSSRGGDSRPTDRLPRGSLSTYICIHILVYRKRLSHSKGRDSRPIARLTDGSLSIYVHIYAYSNIYIYIYI